MSSTDFTLDSSLRAGLTDEEPYVFRPVVQSTPVNFEKPVNKTLQDWLYEYRSTVSSLEQEISKYQGEHKDLKNQVFQLIDENQRLNQDLKECLQKQMTPSTEAKQMQFQVESLKKQLSASIDAKDSALQMWNMALTEVERLERTVEKCQQGTDLSLLEAKAAEIHREYNKALQLVQAEAEKSKKNFLKSSAETENLRKDFEAQVQKNGSLSKKIGEQEGIITQLKSEIQDTRTDILRLETEVANLVIKFQDKEKELKDVTRDNEKMARRLLQLERENKQILEREEESLKRARESLHLAEEALLEKDTAVFREQEAHREMELLQKALDELTQTAALSTSEAVAAAKRRSEDVMKKLTAELRELEVDHSETQCRLERALRDKESLSVECNRLREEWQKSEGGGEVFQSLCQKLSQAEIDRDTYRLRNDTLTASLQLANTRNMETEERLNGECQNMKALLKDCQMKLQAKYKECNAFLKERQELNSRFENHQTQNAKIQFQLRNQVSLLERRMEEQISEHHQQLQAEFQTRATSLQEVNSLLNAQQELTTKWKKESSLQAERFEEEMKKLQKKVSDLRSQRDDLQKELSLLQTKLEKAEEKILLLSNENLNLSKRLQLAEQLYKAHLSS